MKKILFASALAAALVGMSDGIESANTVGYLDYPLVTGYNLFAPTFEGVATAMDIQDIKILGSEGWQSEFIYVLDADGILTDQSYSWQCPDASGLDKMCWVDDLSSEAAELTITEGMGFYIYTDLEDCSVQCAGQVKLGGYERALAQGYNITGNFSPVDLSIQDITIDGSEGWQSEFIYILDADGILTEQSYSWQCPDASGLDKMCWVDDATAEEAAVTIKAGEGIYLYTDLEGCSIKLPAAIAAPVAE